MSAMPAHADPYAIGITGVWESKFVSEGRDWLDEGGLFSIEALAEWEEVTVGAWGGVGDSESYEELDALIEYGLVAGSFDAYLGYTRVEYLEDD